jgi:hypothetical protein
MHLLTLSNPAINPPHAPKLSGASRMSPKALITALVLFVSLSVSQALALTPDELAKAQELGSQLNPPVDIAELLAQAEKYDVPCDPTSKNRIRICSQKIKNAQIDAEIEASKARTQANYAEIEASKARVEASKVRTQTNYAEAEKLKAESDRLDRENAELIKKLQRIIEEKN